MSSADIAEPIALPSLGEASRVWWKIGILSFGGPAAQIALMHREFVETRAWLSERQFLSALSFCMLLPGPEAMQLATYTGWRLHGTLGGLVAGLAFVLPGAAIILALAAIYVGYGDVPLVTAMFFGIKAAVLVIVVEALLRVAKRALGRPIHWLIAALGFVGLFLFSVPYPIIILAAAGAGLAMGRSGDAGQSVPAPDVSPLRTLSTVLTWLAIWVLPLVALAALGAPDILVEIGRFFSVLAVVTFGGAYAVLAYVAQDAVVAKEWLTAGEMVDALGLAETTPGPLILVTEFVGFVAGYRSEGTVTGIAAAVVTLWVTFVPCFLWIFAGAPYIEWVSGRPRLQAALDGITAAVVGVILNLSVWFGLHVLFAEVVRTTQGPLVFWVPSDLDWRAAVIFLASAFAAFRLHWSIPSVLAVAALIGIGLRLPVS